MSSASKPSLPSTSNASRSYSTGLKSSSASVQTASTYALRSAGSSGSSKRTRDEGEDEPRQTRPDKKRKLPGGLEIAVPAAKPLNKDDLQLASYAMETLCCLGNRARTYGILMDRFKTTFWYYDRSGAVTSESFEYDKNLGQLARFVAAFSCMTVEELGFIPELNPPGGTCLDSDAGLAPTSLANYTMDVGDVTVTLEKPLDPRFGFVGRGTLVYDVTMRKKAAGKGKRKIEKGEAAVVKLSWQVTQRKPEWE